ncbi:MAG TPA: 23S rRNA (cytidine(2498)-2'-O)-methyltransferase RlmM, partial [Arenicellales bacterium]|nr:23S rRNA (cytidine(2498)-2'-O)-methyltransferase RlmM [Arenicellales bacterium]
MFARPGFENEAGREWLDRARTLGIQGSMQPLADTGLVCWKPSTRAAVEPRVERGLAVDSLVFVRDVVFERGRVDPLPKTDRVGALIDVLDTRVPGQWGEVAVHVPEGSPDPDLAAFARKWTAPLAAALRRHGRLKEKRDRGARRLDLILSDFERLIIGESLPRQRAAFPGGRPRLRLPRNAPSRSTLKLEEAFLTLMDEKERERWLAPGMTAADLGASPGGWTFHLVARGMLVTAVDNGPMNAALMQSELVEHVRADGFTWRPDRPCDWMVCDIVDKPRRTVDMVARWFRDGHCRASVFNLKLPM